MTTDQFFNGLLGLLAPFVLIGAIYFAWKMWRKAKKENTHDLPTEYQKPFDDLSQSVLKFQKFEKDRDELKHIVADARIKINTAARLIDSFTEKAEQLVDELAIYETAIAAIMSLDPLKISNAAGQLVSVDEELALMMNSRSRDKAYWEQVNSTLSMDLGIKQGFVKIYRSYARSMMHQVAQFKLNVGANEKLLALAQTGKPLAEVNQQLELAAGKLPTLRVWQIQFEQELLEPETAEQPPLLTGQNKAHTYLRG